VPALTVKNLYDQLSGYAPPDQQFLPMLNMVLPRLYGMGYWRDLCYELQVTTSEGYFGLPEEAESVMMATVEGQPKSLWAQWHDYKIAGLPNSYSTDPVFGVVDDGFYPTKDMLDPEVNHTLSVAPVTPNTLLPSTGKVYVEFVRDTDDAVVQYIFSLDGSSGLISTGYTDIRRVTEIRYEGVPQKVEVRAAVSGGSGSFVIATAKGSGVARYRRYRIQDPTNNPSTNVALLVKRAFLPLSEDTDVVYLGNVNAIKHGILATTAEDNADIERAQYHWAVCKQLLEEEKDAHRGGARHAVMVDPYSSGGRIVNMY
jgi:hypothetical protein